MVLSFPKFFPDNCPPPEATDSEIVLYRLCEGSTPTESDFVSFYELHPERYKNMINAYGLSVFSAYADCITAIRKSPKLKSKYRYVSRGLNTPQRGKTLLTPSKTNPNHITWWVYEGVKPHTFFTTCEEGGENGE